MKLKQTDFDDAGGSIFTDEKGKPILNIQFSMDLTTEEVKELITYIENYSKPSHFFKQNFNNTQDKFCMVCNKYLTDEIHIRL